MKPDIKKIQRLHSVLKDLANQFEAGDIQQFGRDAAVSFGNYPPCIFGEALTRAGWQPNTSIFANENALADFLYESEDLFKVPFDVRGAIHVLALVNDVCNWDDPSHRKRLLASIDTVINRLEAWATLLKRETAS